MYQILGYFNAAVAAPATDLVAIPDSSFSARGGTAGNAHWIFTEPYNLCAVMAAAKTLLAAQIFDATFNAINIPQIYPPNLEITPLPNPNVMDMRHLPQPLPLNEEIAVNVNAGAGGAEPVYALFWIKPANDMNGGVSMMPSLSNPRVFALVNATITLTAGVWSDFAPINFVNPVKGGAYQVNGAYWTIAKSLAFKLNFVKAPLYQGRKLFPGGLVENAYGNVPLRFGPNWLGPMGRFNNFELPQVSALGTTTTASATYVGILDLTYLGTTGADAMP